MPRIDLPGGQYLSPAEAETLGFVLHGHKARDVADLRGCVQRTIYWHTDAAYRKLGIRGALNAWRRLDDLGLLERILETANGE